MLQVIKSQRQVYIKKSKLNICFYLIASLTTSDSCDILFYCLLCACVYVCYFCDCFNPAFSCQNTINVMLSGSTVLSHIRSCWVSSC